VIWEREIVRMINGLVVERGLWRVRVNQELREICKDLDIVLDIQHKRLERVGHVARKDQGSTIKKDFESNPEESKESNGWKI
jgi:hypothetical protein